MAISNEWTEWHLTPRGWEAGSKKRDHSGTHRVERPQDAVLTCTYYDIRTGPGSQPYDTEDYRIGDDSLVHELLGKFGSFPRSL